MHHEDSLRLIAFGAVFGILAMVELAMPRRRLTASKSRRWLGNLSLVALNSLGLRIAFPLSLSMIAEFARSNCWGVFNNVELPAGVAVVLAVIALDLVIYLQHVLFHALPILWRLHRVHHADLDVDISTGIRFHTLEMLLSYGIKCAAVLLLGVPALAVLAFEILLNATSLFNHANIKLPNWLDCVLRLFIVTPDMHRIHHSANADERNMNFGFNLPWWDYLLGTYLAAPANSQTAMPLGLAEMRDEDAADSLPAMLVMPFHELRSSD